MSKTSGSEISELKKLTKFFCISLIGLVVDISIFQLLISLKFWPIASNIISSAFAIFIIYFFSSYVFGNKQRNLKTATATYVWYFCSIFFFSGVIQWGTVTFDVSPLIFKLFSLPISFGVNYFGLRAIFQVAIFQKKAERS